MAYIIHQGDNVHTLKTLADNSVDAIVTDPPYGIEFLGKDWDSNTGAVETWSQCLRVLKPGGHLLAFSAARTYHHLATNIESVGFEIRDQLMWLYASGFPKAQDIGKSIQRRQGVEKYHTEKGTNAYPHTTKNQKMVVGSVTADDYKKEKTHPIPTSPEAQQWAGWKTALKPAHEPIVMARKPFKGSTIDNVLTHGVGALNIDATRIETDETIAEPKRGKGVFKEQECGWNKDDYNGDYKPNEQGRFPSNVLGEVEGYQKFFYSPKVSRKERHCGFENTLTKTDMLNELGGYFCDKDGNPTNDSNMCYVPGPGKIYIHGLKHEYEKIMGKQDQIVTELQMIEQMGGYYINKQREEQSQTGKDIWLPHKGHILVHGLKEVYAQWLKQQKRDPLAHIPTNPEGMLDKNGGTRYIDGGNKQHNVGNNHPTVKPVALMRYLIELITPPNSTVLDPFCGSGSTGMAACELGHTFIGCELDPHYVSIAKRRIEGWIQPQPGTLEHINTYNRRLDGLESAGIQGLQQLKQRRDNRPDPRDLFEFE